MSQSIIPFAEMQDRIQSLAERLAAAGAKLQARLGGKAFRNGSAEDQAKTLVAGALLTALAEPIGKLVQALGPLLPAPEGSNVFAEIVAEAAEEALQEAGVKKDALLLSVAEVNSRLLPVFEQLVGEAEEKLA